MIWGGLLITYSITYIKENSMEVEYKSYCELVITSDTVTPDLMTEMIEITPNRSFRKGDPFISARSGSKGIRRQNLWAIKSNEVSTEEDDILVHIDYFKKLFEGKSEIFRKLKKDSVNEISFWVWIESKEDGVGLDIPEAALNFIDNVCNRLHFSFIGNCEKI